MGVVANGGQRLTDGGQQGIGFVGPQLAVIDALKRDGDLVGLRDQGLGFARSLLWRCGSVRGVDRGGLGLLRVGNRSGE